MPVCYLAVFTHPNQTPPQFNIEGSLRQALPFEPDHITDFQQTQACVWVWGKTPGVHLAPFVAKHDETLAVMSGYGLERGAEGVLGAKTFLRCGPQKFGEIWERFDGGWSGMVLNNTEVAAGSSCEGVEHVYYHQCDKYVIISNRGRLIWNLLKSLDEPLEPDWTTLGMLAALSYPTATNGTAVKNINLLLQHQQIHVKFDAEDLSVDVREHPRLFFINQSATKPPHTYKSSSEALSGHVRSLKNIQAPLRAALTGGKDSRLVLALLLERGA